MSENEAAAMVRGRKWRAFSNHSVSRVIANSAESIPCYCWATKDHPLGNELRTPPTPPPPPTGPLVEPVAVAEAGGGIDG